MRLLNYKTRAFFYSILSLLKEANVCYQYNDQCCHINGSLSFLVVPTGWIHWSVNNFDNGSHPSRKSPYHTCLHIYKEIHRETYPPKQISGVLTGLSLRQWCDRWLQNINITEVNKIIFTDTIPTAHGTEYNCELCKCDYKYYKLFQHIWPSHVWWEYKLSFSTTHSHGITRKKMRLMPCEGWSPFDRLELIEMNNTALYIHNFHTIRFVNLINNHN